MKTLDKKEIGFRFGWFMEVCGYRQESLARMLNTSQHTVSNIKRGKYLPTTRLLTALALEFGVNINWLLYRQGDMFTDDNLGKETRFRENYPELSALMEVPDVAVAIFSKLAVSRKIFSEEIESFSKSNPQVMS